MSQTEDQLDSGGGITHMVFYADHLGCLAIRDCLDQRLHALRKSF